MSTNQGYKDPDYMKKWRAANRERLLQYSREKYAANREKAKAATISWQRRNPDRVRLTNKVACANKRYPGKITIDDLITIIERDGRKCKWCGRKNLNGWNLTLEHLQPYNSLETLTIACFRCNASRCSKLGEPRKSRSRKREERKRYHKNWRTKNTEHVLRKSREYKEKNREKLKQYLHDYRLRRKAEAEARGEKYRG